jgi:predicted ATPase/DNA-binding CsgD family transcriptional regulator
MLSEHSAGLTTLPPRSSNLPVQPRQLIGRERELRIARERLLDADVRLLTLTGPPGVGKTRLAIELARSVADEFDDGVRFVDLAPVVDSSIVILVIARALGLNGVDRRVVFQVVEELLSDRSLLLLLDNFEQVLDVADLVGQLLATCPHLKVVVTSRAPLHLQWEHEQAIPPLALAPLDAALSPEDLADSPACRLFVERARALVPDFALTAADARVVAEICARLDGLPLAIELAAARIKLFPPRALLRRLPGPDQAEAGEDSTLRLLSDSVRDLPPRQQTLLRAISWSYDLLEDNERALLRRLSVFVGGCTLDAAERVGIFDMTDGVDLLASLIDKSLVWRQEQADGEPRLRMLTTIREYARDQLELTDEAEDIRARWAAYFVELVESAPPELAGPLQFVWFTRLERERANLRAVERWAIARGDAEVVVRLAAALWPFWLAREDAVSARARLDALLSLVSSVPPSSSVVRAMQGAGLLAEKLGDYATCRSLLERSVELARSLPDRHVLASVLDSLGRQAFIEGRYGDARALLEESHALVCELLDAVGMARVLSHLGFLEHLEGHPREARAIFERGLALARQVQDQHRVAEFLDNLGNTFEVEGDLDRAASMFADAVAIWRTLGQGHWLAMALNNMGKVQIRRGELESARAQLLEAMSIAHRIGNRRRMAFTLSAVAALALAEGQVERAATLRRVAEAAVAEIGANPPVQGVVTARPEPTSGALSLDQAIAESLVRLTRPGSVPANVADGLTRREREVATLIASGRTNKQIAQALVLSEGTAENYVQRLLGKLNFKNRAQVAVWALEHGLGPDTASSTER